MNMQERSNTILSLDRNPPRKAKAIPALSDALSKRAFSALSRIIRKDAPHVLLYGPPDAGKTLVLRSVIPVRETDKRRMIYMTAHQLGDLLMESNPRTKWLEYAMNAITVLLVDNIDPQEMNGAIWTALNRVIIHAVDYDLRLWLAMEGDDFDLLKTRLSAGTMNKVRKHFEQLELP